MWARPAVVQFLYPACASSLVLSRSSMPSPLYLDTTLFTDVSVIHPQYTLRDHTNPLSTLS